MEANALVAQDCRGGGARSTGIVSMLESGLIFLQEVYSLVRNDHIYIYIYIYIYICTEMSNSIERIGQD